MLLNAFLNKKELAVKVHKWIKAVVAEFSYLDESLKTKLMSCDCARLYRIPTLDLIDNLIEYEGAKAIASAQSQLTSLYLAGNQVSFEAKEEL